MWTTETGLLHHKIESLKRENEWIIRKIAYKCCPSKIDSRSCEAKYVKECEQCWREAARKAVRDV